MNPIFLEIYGIKIRYYSLIYMIIYYLGIWLVGMEFEKRNIPKHLAKKLGFWTMLSGILGARIYYVVLRWEQFSDDPLSTINIFKGIQGLAFHGGLIGGGIAIYLFAKKHNIGFWTLTDILTPVTMFLQAIGRIGNLMNGETHGVPTFTPLSVLWNGTFDAWKNNYLSNPMKKFYPNLVPWGIVFPPNSPAGMEFPNMPIHPTMIYEMILNIIAASILYFYFSKKRSDMKPGTISGLFLIFAGIIRPIVSFFRAEDLLILGIRAPYIVGMLFVLTGSGLIYIKNRK
jgi:phosphatidylglycerol:prolipoprotein diacylglycerol transferase